MKIWNFCLYTISFTGYYRAISIVEVSSHSVCYKVVCTMYMYIEDWGELLSSFSNWLISFHWFCFSALRSFLFISSSYSDRNLYLVFRVCVCMFGNWSWFRSKYIEVGWIGTNRFSFCEFISYIAYFYFDVFLFSFSNCIYVSVYSVQYRCAQITSVKVIFYEFIFLYHRNHTSFIFLSFSFQILMNTKQNHHVSNYLLFIIHWILNIYWRM